MERSWKQGSAKSTEVACSVLDRGGCTGHRKALSLCEHFHHVGTGEHPEASLVIMPPFSPPYCLPALSSSGSHGTCMPV